MKNRKVKYSFAERCKNNDRQNYLDLWDYELNEMSPHDVSCGAGKRYFFKCPRNIHSSEERQMLSITRHKLQPYCAKCNSLGQYMIDNLGSDAIDKYWSDQNTKSPFDVLRGNKESVWIKCDNILHPDYQIAALHFTRGHRCSVCCDRKIIAGINDVATTHPWCVKYFKNQDDAKRCSFGSENRYIFKCPICNTEKEMAIWVLIAYGFSCNMCGDGVSYPNKFMYNVLSQLKQRGNLMFESEKVFEWSKFDDDMTRRIYDFWIDDNQIVIEVHGRQHFEDCSKGSCFRSLSYEQENDLFKRELAIKNGIRQENYIIIDARESNMLYMKNSVMQSRLPKLLDFAEQDIDWQQCDLCASKSLLVDVCGLWNNGLHNTQSISSIIGLSNTSVITYLQRGTAAGLCDYNPRSRIPILCLDNQYVFPYATLCEKHSGSLFGQHIKARYFNDVASGRKDNINGFRFVYITRKEFAQIKETEPNRVYE